MTLYKLDISFRLITGAISVCRITITHVLIYSGYSIKSLSKRHAEKTARTKEYVGIYHSVNRLTRTCA